MTVTGVMNELAEEVGLAVDWGPGWVLFPPEESPRPLRAGERHSVFLKVLFFFF